MRQLARLYLKSSIKLTPSIYVSRFRVPAQSRASSDNALSHVSERQQHNDEEVPGQPQIPNKYNGSTIYALSTAPGRAAIAIIRVSGPAWLTIYYALCPGMAAPKPRYATLRTLYDPKQASAHALVIDSGALVFYYPAPETTTGEDVLEFHVHGGTAVVKAVLSAISKVLAPGTGHPLRRIRYAEPGEFTRRAFYNNKLDLTQVEALGDTLSAETEQQRRLAVRGTSGALAERYESWRHQLLYARGELEALIDFSEDQHFDESPANLCASVATQVHQLKVQIRASIESASRGEMLRNGISIALVGAPNVGKSSLLNKIIGRDAAIVSSEAGTTRDVIDINVDIGGFHCRFGDLAGLRRQSRSPGAQPIGNIEREGMERAKTRARNADVVIVVLSAEDFQRREGRTISAMSEVGAVLKDINRDTQRVICVINKSDLDPNLQHSSNARYRVRHLGYLMELLKVSATPVLAISCKEKNFKNPRKTNPIGVEAFLKALTDLFKRMTTAVPSEHDKSTIDNSLWTESLGATERQKILLQQCLQYLESFLEEVHSVNGTDGHGSGQEEDVDVVLAAEHLRGAADCLAKITGKGEVGSVEEVLGVVFEKCVARCVITVADANRGT